MGLIFSVSVIAFIFMVIEGFEYFQRFSCLPYDLSKKFNLKNVSKGPMINNYTFENVQILQLPYK